MAATALFTNTAVAGQASETSAAVATSGNQFLTFTVTQAPSSALNPVFGAAVAVELSSDGTSFGQLIVLGYLSPSPKKGYTSTEEYQVDVRGYSAAKLYVKNIDLAPFTLNAKANVY